MLNEIPIALQLYSIREEGQKDLAGTLAAVAKMGYAGVEFAGYYDHSAAEVKRLLDANGLSVAGTHTGLGALQGDEFARTIEFNKAIGNRYIIVPGLPSERRNSVAALRETAAIFNELSAKVESEGLHFGYHNHAWEFEPVDGVRPWDILAGETEPAVVTQLDIGHVLRGGGDPVAELKARPGRAKTVHIKDYSPTNDKALVGEGDVPWPDVFKLCETSAGTEWYIVEQESYPVSPLESVARSLDNLKALLQTR